MIKGKVIDRDSLGNVQIIRPGQVNLMTAGRGITHTEESLSDEHHLHAAQLWIALLEANDNCAPALDHYPDLPVWDDGWVKITLLAGSFEGRTTPSRILSPIEEIDLRSQAAASPRLAVDPRFEYGILPLEDALTINGQTFASNELAYLGLSLSEVESSSDSASRALVLGGKPFAEEIQLCWNFVSPSRLGIVQALEAWNNLDLARFGDVAGFDGQRLVAPRLPC